MNALTELEQKLGVVGVRGWHPGLGLLHLAVHLSTTPTHKKEGWVGLSAQSGRRLLHFSTAILVKQVDEFEPKR